MIWPFNRHQHNWVRLRPSRHVHEHRRINDLLLARERYEWDEICSDCGERRVTSEPWHQWAQPDGHYALGELPCPTCERDIQRRRRRA